MGLDDGDSAPPPIPKAETSDLEDVSWALSTALASWHRGDRTESLKWLRRAAEAATEGSANVRAVVLAKAAADLASALGRQSLPPTIAAPPPPPTSPSVVATARSGPPSKPPPPPSHRPLPPAPPSQRPSPSSGTRTTGPPPPPPPRRPTPAPFSAAMHPSKMPLATQGPTASTLNSRGNDASKKSRKSSQNLDAEARAAKTSGPASRARQPSGTNHEARRRRSSRPPPSEHPATEQVPVGIIPRSPSVADEIDAWPTQAMEGAALTDLTNEMARAESPPMRRPAPSVPPAAKDRGAPTQAIRVLVWRTPEGLRVAPLGTSVQAPAVEAILVALDPSADLAAWLVRR